MTQLDITQWSADMDKLSEERADAQINALPDLDGIAAMMIERMEGLEGEEFEVKVNEGTEWEHTASYTTDTVWWWERKGWKLSIRRSYAFVLMSGHRTDIEVLHDPSGGRKLRTSCLETGVKHASINDKIYFQQGLPQLMEMIKERQRMRASNERNAALASKEVYGELTASPILLLDA